MGSAWRLPGYRVERLLGAGAFGEVWSASVRATGSPVALKRVRATDRARYDAAVAEAAVLGALDHPNLIRLHRVERTDDAIVLVLDLAAGGSLAALLGARGRLTPGETISALAPIASALASAHVAGVVHGDVTPANILFSELGLPLLADLGVARLTGDRKPVHTTLPYADPVVAQGFPPDELSDVYMLGAVALHTLTGHPPPSAVGELDPAAWSARLAARLAAAQVPPATAALVGRAMSLDPDVRRGAGEFALDLRASGVPVAVELAAGRARVEPSVARLAAIAGGRPTGSAMRGPTWSPAASPASGPAGSAAVPVEPVPGKPPLTQGARLPAPVLPARHRAGRLRQHRFASALERRRAVLLTGLVAVLVAIGSARAASVVAHRPDSAREPSVRTAPARTAPVRTSAPSARAARAHRAAPVALTVRDGTAALAALRSLDAARADAYASRDAGRLGRVYASATLLARDRAALAALVPAGCGLTGVRTRFGTPRAVRATPDAVAFTVAARVQPSILRCAGRVAGTAPGTATADFAVRLVRVGDGWRIAGEHPVDGARQ